MFSKCCRIKNVSTVAERAQCAATSEKRMCCQIDEVVFLICRCFFLFAVCFFIWLCCEHLQHVCCKIYEVVFLICRCFFYLQRVELSRPPYVSHLKHSEQRVDRGCIRKLKNAALGGKGRKVGRHQVTSESKVSFTSCLMRYLHLIDFWRQHSCILHCLWYPTILCVPFRDGWAKK